jgi:hypothetical protein
MIQAGHMTIEFAFCFDYNPLLLDLDIVLVNTHIHTHTPPLPHKHNGLFKRIRQMKVVGIQNPDV